MSDRTRTHWTDCWKSSDHHECALVLIDTLRQRIDELESWFDANAANLAAHNIGGYHVTEKTK